MILQPLHGLSSKQIFSFIYLLIFFQFIGKIFVQDSCTANEGMKVCKTGWLSTDDNWQQERKCEFCENCVGAIGRVGVEYDCTCLHVYM
jgi:hypothetical protein